MAKVLRTTVDAQLTVLLELSEVEARALEAIFGYNVDVFLKVFYERMGKAYVQPHEKGVRSLHDTIRSTLSEPLRKANTARRGLLDAVRAMAED